MPFVSTATTITSPPPSAGWARCYNWLGERIERVVVDVSRDAYVDHENEVLAWLARD
jgi:hypothetical protein